jgi:diaminopimelate epimerase
MIAISKAHAYGNDFLFVPHDQVEDADPHELARRLCARHAGVGADGLILYTIAFDGSARMTLYNADGSPSELSGNGLRCLAALLVQQRESLRLDPMNEVRVETDAGWKTLTVVGRSSGRYTFRAAMGQPTDIRAETLEVEGERMPVTTLGMGNPQCVALVDRLPTAARFHRFGPALSKHARFAAGTNVEFAQIDSPSDVRILIWERGVGPTTASGTGACAAAVAAIVHGGAAKDVNVIAPGGTQRVEWRDDGIYLTGWAEVVFEGQWLVPLGGRA